MDNKNKQNFNFIFNDIEVVNELIYSLKLNIMSSSFQENGVKVCFMEVKADKSEFNHSLLFTPPIKTVCPVLQRVISYVNNFHFA